MFKCQACIAKDAIIEMLKEQNKDLLNRLMSFNKDAFIAYQAETKQGEPLFPIGVDAQGKQFSYKDTDLEKRREEEFRAFGEEFITVEDDEKDKNKIVN